MRARNLSRVLSVTITAFALSLAPEAAGPLLGQGAAPPLPADPGFLPVDSTSDEVGPPPPPLFLADRMERMLSQASSMGVLTSLIVSRRDSVLVEEYYRGLRPNADG